MEKIKKNYKKIIVITLITMVSIVALYMVRVSLYEDYIVSYTMEEPNRGVEDRLMEYEEDMVNQKNINVNKINKKISKTYQTLELVGRAGIYGDFTIKNGELIFDEEPKVGMESWQLPGFVNQEARTGDLRDSNWRNPSEEDINKFIEIAAKELPIYVQNPTDEAYDKLSMTTKMLMVQSLMSLVPDEHKYNTFDFTYPLA